MNQRQKSVFKYIKSDVLEYPGQGVKLSTNQSLFELHFLQASAAILILSCQDTSYTIARGDSLTCINVAKLLVQQAKPDMEVKTGSREAGRRKQIDRQLVQQRLSLAGISRGLRHFTVLYHLSDSGSGSGYLTGDLIPCSLFSS